MPRGSSRASRTPPDWPRPRSPSAELTRIIPSAAASKMLRYGPSVPSGDWGLGRWFMRAFLMLNPSAWSNEGTARVSPGLTSEGAALHSLRMSNRQTRSAWPVGQAISLSRTGIENWGEFAQRVQGVGAGGWAATVACGCSRPPLPDRHIALMSASMSSQFKTSCRRLRRLPHSGSASAKCDATCPLGFPQVAETDTPHSLDAAGGKLPQNES